MIQKKITRQNLSQHSSAQENLAYWLSRPPEERIAAVECLRQQYYGSSARLQRIARVIQRPPR